MTPDGYILKHIADLLATIDRLEQENQALRDHAQGLTERLEKQEKKPE